MLEINPQKGNLQLLENIKNIYRKISSAAIRSGRSPFDVQLIAVTKTVPVERIREAVELGLRDFGENRVQEAKEKISNLKSKILNENIKWHLIGHLQKNKVKTAVQLFDLIHSLDSFELANLINKYAEKEEKIQRVLIQVKLSEEATKHGVAKEELMRLIETVSKMKNIKLEGLMTMPPFFEDPEKARPFFKKLCELRDEVEQKGYKIKELSIGMTNDFEIAILEGATMVRIGTGIFGERIINKRR
ncbi:MAG: YggS family pyridoxal phosphate-dependent enzyme [Nitrospirae bacterium]|nr:YggS family pyridoxal phosphate-dependent enzyme [Nitrospirota bacterium]